MYGLQVPPAAPKEVQAPTNGSSGADGSLVATPAAPQQNTATKQDAAAGGPNWQIEAKQDEEIVNLAVMKNGVLSMAP